MSTICAISTRNGGAIGIVRTSGPDAIAITDKIFHNKNNKSLAQAKPYSILYGSITDSNTIVDEVLVSVFRAPKSYTGEDCTEISCHGSSYILNKVVELLLRNGCEMARPGEFTQRAFLNGRMDLSQAEAVADLIASQNKASHRIAMQQMRGGYSLKLKSLRQQLLELTTLLELELDFSEEDVEFADRNKLVSVAERIKNEITQLTETFHLGNAIKNGIPVAIIGAPNVGKSTLLNALLKEDKAIVSNIQGTTRDLIEDTVTIGEITFRFIDTAGIRHTDDAIEKLGIERSRKAANKAKIIILITEPGIEFPHIDIKPDQTIIKIYNKTDSFQALYGIGIKELEEQLLASVQLDQTDNIIITNLRHFEALSLAKEDITRSIEAFRINLPGDLISEDLRQCLNHLGEIIGEITNNDILANIFDNFCIGK